jgi:hypothetical protein
MASYGSQTVTVPTLSISNASATEGDDVQFNVTLSTAATSVVSAHYSFAAGPAPLTDFDSTAGIVTFPIGATRETIDVPTYGDSTAANEQFNVTLASITNATFASGQSTASATGTITPAAVTTIATTTVLNASSAALSVGGSLTLTATVTDPSGVPSGSVSFSDGNTVIGTVNLNAAGAASFTTTSLGAGAHSITAHYAGNGNVLASTSTATSVLVNPVATLIGTALTLTAVNGTLVSGQPDSFTFSVSSAGSIPTGTVTLFDNGNVVGTYPLAADGTADITVSASSSSVMASFTANYSGDASHAASTSGPVAQAILPASAVIPAIGKPTFPAAGIAGQPFIARIPMALKNTGAVQRGCVTVSAGNNCQ